MQHCVNNAPQRMITFANKCINLNAMHGEDIKTIITSLWSLDKL